MLITILIAAVAVVIVIAVVARAAAIVGAIVVPMSRWTLLSMHVAFASLVGWLILWEVMLAMYAFHTTTYQHSDL